MSLEHRYRNAHLQLTVWCSEGGVQNPNATHAGKPVDRILYDLGEPLTEQTIRVFERRWATAVTVEHQTAVVDDMETEVARVRYPEPQERPAETELERRARILKDTEGWEPDDVARSRHGVTAREIRRWRKQVGRDTETGRAGPATRASSKDVKDQVIALWLERDRNRLTRNEIGRRVGVHHEVVKRIIGEWERSQRDVA